MINVDKDNSPFYGGVSTRVQLCAQFINLIKKFFAVAQNDILKQNGFKAAFTLAEVLVTLGIIGVVAAMTLPAVINKTQNMQLEAAFKKAYSNLQNAFNLTIADEVPIYVLNPTESRPDGDPDFNSQFAQEMYKKYKQLTKLSYSEKQNYEKIVKTYTKDVEVTWPRCSQFLNGTEAFVAPDGSLLSIVQNCGRLWMTIDTNGLKGPNALGHDIFLFASTSDNKILQPATYEVEYEYDEDGNIIEDENGNPISHIINECSKSGASTINGITCGVFAVQNRCPDNPSKTYWECLP